MVGYPDLRRPTLSVETATPTIVSDMGQQASLTDEEFAVFNPGARQDAARPVSFE